jgi:hypothetical protein
MEYLIFLKYGGVFAAIIAAVIIWRKKGSDTIDKPTELEDGNFAIPKPEDEFMDGVDFDEIRTDITPKQDVQAMAARLPNPDGTPTKGPR